MTNAVTKHMAREYVQEAPAPMALSSLFTSDSRNYYSLSSLSSTSNAKAKRSPLY